MTATIIGYSRHSLTRRKTTILRDLLLLTLWAGSGLALTGLMFALGFGPDLLRALAAAG